MKYVYFVLLASIFIKADGQPKYIFWTNASDNLIYRFELKNQSLRTIVTDGLGFPWRLQVDNSNKKLYWSNVDKNSIQRSNLDGTEKEDIALISYPQGLALDEDGGKLYVTETGTPRILQIDLRNNSIVTLITEALVDPDDIVLDKHNNRLFWIDTGLKRIGYYMINEDKSGILIKELIDPQSLQLDEKNQLLYWSDGQMGRINVTDLDSGVTKILIDGLVHPTSVSFNEKHKLLFWVDTGSKKIQYSDLKGSNIKDLISHDLSDFHVGIISL